MKKRTFGAECEWFITQNGVIVPRVEQLLPLLQLKAEANGFRLEQFSAELCASQIEGKTIPAKNLAELVTYLKQLKTYMSTIARELKLGLLCREFVTEAELGRLEVDPFGKRHQKIWQGFSHKKKVAASQVAALNIHISASIEEAYRVINFCDKKVIDRLILQGDNSSGQRIAAYRLASGLSGYLPRFSSVGDLTQYIEQKDEKNIWNFVRYKPSTGTLEFRMWGATENGGLIHRLALSALGLVNES